VCVRYIIQGIKYMAPFENARASHFDCKAAAICLRVSPVSKAIVIDDDDDDGDDGDERDDVPSFIAFSLFLPAALN